MQRMYRFIFHLVLLLLFVGWSRPFYDTIAPFLEGRQMIAFVLFIIFLLLWMVRLAFVAYSTFPKWNEWMRSEWAPFIWASATVVVLFIIFQTIIERESPFYTDPLGWMALLLWLLLCTYFGTVWSAILQLKEEWTMRQSIWWTLWISGGVVLLSLTFIIITYGTMLVSF